VSDTAAVVGKVGDVGFENGHARAPRKGRHDTSALTGLLARAMLGA
jgi:hypothetical protein